MIPPSQKKDILIQKGTYAMSVIPRNAIYATSVHRYQYSTFILKYKTIKHLIFENGISGVA
jgi:effector-binding domain-containing protein